MSAIQQPTSAHQSMSMGGENGMAMSAAEQQPVSTFFLHSSIKLWGTNLASPRLCNGESTLDLQDEQVTDMGPSKQKPREQMSMSMRGGGEGEEICCGW